MVRRQDLADRRVTLIELTAFGRRSLQRHQVRAEQRVARLLSALPPAKRADLLSGLTALREAVETSAARTEPPGLAGSPACPTAPYTRRACCLRDPHWTRTEAMNNRTTPRARSRPLPELR